MSQVGYGQYDVVGAPFNLQAGAAGVVTGNTITMTAAGIVFNGAATIAAQTVVLPLNPADGAVAEISSLQVITALTVNASAGDVIVNGVLGVASTITPVAATGGSSTGKVSYKYSLNGFVTPTTGVVVNARTWFRVQ